ncbi:MAG TPA: hypothetical protein VK638_52340 [Edaphobacter sp.]|nr:hypothetical protein [Edaphobacter sp.]
MPTTPDERRVSLKQIMDFLGHSDIETTMKYLGNAASRTVRPLLTESTGVAIQRGTAVMYAPRVDIRLRQGHAARDPNEPDNTSGRESGIGYCGAAPLSSSTYVAGSHYVRGGWPFISRADFDRK